MPLTSVPTIIALREQITCPNWYLSRGVSALAFTEIVTFRLSLPLTLKAAGDTDTSNKLPASAEPCAVKVTRPRLFGSTDVSVRTTVKPPLTSPAMEGLLKLAASQRRSVAGGEGGGGGGG